VISGSAKRDKLDGRWKGPEKIGRGQILPWTRGGPTSGPSENSELTGLHAINQVTRGEGQGKVCKYTVERWSPGKKKKTKKRQHDWGYKTQKGQKEGRGGPCTGEVGGLVEVLPKQKTSPYDPRLK